VHDGDPPGRVEVGMRVAIGDAPLRRPSGVRDAYGMAGDGARRIAHHADRIELIVDARFLDDCLGGIIYIDEKKCGGSIL